LEKQKPSKTFVLLGNKKIGAGEGNRTLVSITALLALLDFPQKTHYRTVNKGVF
jgi:hypothetical protein